MSKNEAEKKLQDLNGWELEGDHTISRTFKFEQYLEGVDFASKIANHANEKDHHPKMVIDFNKVTISWTTHSENGLTDTDFEGAEYCNRLYDIKQDTSR
ncbi:4a-hydroxytetrahydrobiopterin dehydratase [Halalkalibacillus halophilus]|uniref:4a-hydroxytetrahydrobiopterin dehydratase n=1 Tax=Halalkalibacillus halophilus TaxID=392827 RepID=UPI001FE23BA2|nr:4a-hydroxytetrahydrobiopterin dehydratase [Halalkalibacillus halophilus]